MENYTVLEQLQEIIDKTLVLGVVLEGKIAEDNELKNLISSIKYPEIDLKNYIFKYYGQRNKTNKLYRPTWR